MIYDTPDDHTNYIILHHHSVITLFILLSFIKCQCTCTCFHFIGISQKIKKNTCTCTYDIECIVFLKHDYFLTELQYDTCRYKMIVSGGLVHVHTTYNDECTLSIISIFWNHRKGKVFLFISNFWKFNLFYFIISGWVFFMSRYFTYMQIHNGKSVI